MASSARGFAFFLPQFHPIPENDRWWGTGFTEWRNVAKARRFFPGHYQPRIPGHLGFYDLRVEDVRQQQGELAKLGALEGFAYWHYWFGGRRLLERPLDDILETGIHYGGRSFFLAWANRTWEGIWHGARGRTLIEQSYPVGDTEAHFRLLARFFQHPSYARVGDCPILYVLEPLALPNPRTYVARLRELANEHGLPGLGLPKCYLYSRRPIERPEPPRGSSLRIIPVVLPNWDSTPRVGRRGVVLLAEHADRFREHLREAVGRVASHPPEERLVLIKSWNEWAEGNHLEPDERFGAGWLHACRSVLCGAEATHE